MFDGDKLLVTNSKTLVNAAERNNKNKDIVPLFYNMSKAKAEIVTPESLYNGLILAYTGGNIGEISNAITKIWNSGEITEEKLKAIKWLVLINNFVIDYAKTLYKPAPPKEVTDIISKYTKGKVPYFFKFAKSKDEDKISEISDSAVDRIGKLYKKRNITNHFKQDHLGTFNYQALMHNPNIEFDEKIAKDFRKITSNLNFNQTNDKKLYNQYAVYDEAKKKILECELSEEDITDILILDLFKNRNTPRKKAFWTLFGDIVYQNVCNNVNSKFAYCERCHNRFYKERSTQKYCTKCQGYQKKVSKTVACCDCGKEFEINSKNTKTIRCSECQHKYILAYDRGRKNKNK